MSPVRTLTRDQTQWRVYEVNAVAVPGAAVPRCLIFDSDSVVRRCWTFPADWASLEDAALWSLLVDATPRPPPPRPADAVAFGATIDAAAQFTGDVIATSRSLSSESRILREPKSRTASR